MSDHWVITVSEHIPAKMKRVVLGWYTALPGELRVWVGKPNSECEELDLNEVLAEQYRRSGGVMLFCPIVEWQY